MPTYEYTCTACGKDFQKFLKTMSDALPACEHCGSERVERRLSVFGVSAGRAAGGPSENCRSCSNGGCPMAGRM